jgi:hypothetical protein
VAEPASAFSMVELALVFFFCFLPFSGVVYACVRAFDDVLAAFSMAKPALVFFFFF